MWKNILQIWKERIQQNRMLNKIHQVSKNNSVKDAEHPTTDSSSIIQDPKVKIIE